MILFQPVDSFKTLKTAFTLSILFIDSPTFFGQSQPDTTDILGLVKRDNYKELNKFQRDSSVTIWQEVFFNDPYKIDEEYEHTLVINISDEKSISKGKTFDLTDDSSLVKCRYQRISPWNWSERSTSIMGKLTIVSMTKQRLELAFDLMVIENKKGIYIYKGNRIVRKTKPV